MPPGSALFGRRAIRLQRASDQSCHSSDFKFYGDLMKEADRTFFCLFSTQKTIASGGCNGLVRFIVDRAAPLPAVITSSAHRRGGGPL